MEQYQLPDGWVWAYLNTVCKKIQDGTHFSPKVQYDTPGAGRYPYITAKNIRANHLDLSDVTYIDESVHRVVYQRCNPEQEDVLLTKDGVNTGIAAVNTLNEEFSLLSSVAVLKPDLSILDPYFLNYYLNSPLGYKMITGQMTGTAIKRIVLKKIRESPIPLPPLTEQKRIVARIKRLREQCETARAALDALPSLLKKVRRRILADAFAGRLTRRCPTDEPASVLLERIHAERYRRSAELIPRSKANGRSAELIPHSKAKAPALPDVSDLPELPEGWVWVTLDSLAEVRNGVTKGRDLSRSKTVEVPYLRVANVQSGYLDLSEIKTIEIKASELERYKLLPNDILFTEGGDRDKLGRGTVWQGEIEPCITQNHVFYARRYADEINPQWISLASQTTYARDYFWAVASQTVNLASINATRLRAFPIPLPPLAEQQRILTRIKSLFAQVEAIEAAVEVARRRVEQAEQAILSRAFRGELVAQDPGDEPAVVLLERIKTGRGVQN